MMQWDMIQFCTMQFYTDEMYNRNVVISILRAIDDLSIKRFEKQILFYT